MTKKNLNIFLSILLIVIWGGIIYKYFFKKSIVENDDLVESNITGNFIPTDKVRDTLVLEFSGRDPFLDAKPIKKTVVPKTTSPKIYKKPEANIIWPQIQYYGFVKSNNSKNELVVIKIDGKLYKARNKENIDELKILRTYSDSVEMELHRNKRFFYRKK